MKKILILALCLIVSVMILGACDKENPIFSKKLDTPQNVRFEGTTLKWEAVENADKYIITVFTNTSSYSIAEEETLYEMPITTAGDYTATVKARKADGSYKDSENSSEVTYHYGTGMIDDPIIIYSKTELSKIGIGAKIEGSGSSQTTTPLYYKLVTDIDLNGEEWAPIGVGDNRFQGHFDGQGYTISNYKITVANGSYYGFFKGVLKGSVKNLNLTGYNIDIQTNGRYRIGGLAGWVTDSEIINCTVNGTLNLKTTDSNTQHIGQMLGYIDKTTEFETSSKVYGCSAEGLMTAQGYIVYGGGFAGYGKNVDIAMCSAKGSINIKSTNAIYGGGFIGSAYSSCVMNYNYSTTSVSCDSTSTINIGCLIGYSYNASFKDNYATGALTNVNQSALRKGFIGYVSGTLTAQNNFYDYQTAGLSEDQDSGGSTTNRNGISSRTTEQMKTQAVYVDWDFETIWTIDELENDGYPALKDYVSGMFDEEEEQQ